MGRGHPFDSCEQQLITRFGMPSILVFVNVAYFSSNLLIEFTLDKGIIIRYSANYYPQGNGVAKSTNKNLIRILKKAVAHNQRNWHSLLHNALWEDRVTPKEYIGNSPYFLVYEQEFILPNGLLFHHFSLLRLQEDNPHQLFKKELIHFSCLKRKGRKKNLSSPLISR
jgi:hypothetical protein